MASETTAVDGAATAEPALPRLVQQKLPTPACSARLSAKRARLVPRRARDSKVRPAFFELQETEPLRLGGLSCFVGWPGVIATNAIARTLSLAEARKWVSNDAQVRASLWLRALAVATRFQERRTLRIRFAHSHRQRAGRASTLRPWGGRKPVRQAEGEAHRGDGRACSCDNTALTRSSGVTAKARAFLAFDRRWHARCF